MKSAVDGWPAEGVSVVLVKVRTILNFDCAPAATGESAAPVARVTPSAGLFRMGEPPSEEGPWGRWGRRSGMFS